MLLYYSNSASIISEIFFLPGIRDEMSHPHTSISVVALGDMFQLFNGLI